MFSHSIEVEARNYTRVIITNGRETLYEYGEWQTSKVVSSWNSISSACFKIQIMFTSINYSLNAWKSLFVCDGAYGSLERAFNLKISSFQNSAIFFVINYWLLKLDWSLFKTVSASIQPIKTFSNRAYYACILKRKSTHPHNRTRKQTMKPPVISLGWKDIWFSLPMLSYKLIFR